MPKYLRCLDSLQHSSLYHCLPAQGGLGLTCSLVFLFPKLAVVPSEELLPIPTTALGTTVGVTMGAVGLTTSPAIHYLFSS